MSSEEQKSQIRSEYASVRILRCLLNRERGMRTSAVKNFIREEGIIVMSLKSLRNYEFINATDYLEKKGYIEAIYPGDATEWLMITARGREFLAESDAHLH